jgi:primosomal protein N''
MNKDVLVLLLQKDIKELQALTEGFENLEKIPNPILKLAQSKADNIIESLEKLEVLQQDNSEKQNLQSDKNDFSIDLEEETIQIFEETEEEVVSESIVEEKREEIEILESDISEENQRDEATFLSEKQVSQYVILNDVLSANHSNVINDSASQKVEDIRQAINVGDRFRFQRELFNGNGEMLNKTLLYLNQLATFAEAESFLLSKFKWNVEDEHVVDFLQIVKRRFQ